MDQKTLKRYKDQFVRIARKRQRELKAYLYASLVEAGYKDVINGDGYLYARGEYVLLTAHMDTVHEKPVKQVRVYAIPTREKPIDYEVTSPQGIGGDDRCGVWIILHVLPTLLKQGIRPAILFCEDEEIGGVGSGKFCKTDYIHELSDMRYLIEVDRANDNDAVFYDDGNRDFQKYVCSITNYEFAHGSFSDISNLCPACGRSGVNLSCGYYGAHTLSEYVSISEMKHTADMVVKLITDTVHNDVSAFDYVDAWGYDGYADRYGIGYGAFSGYDPDDLNGVEFSYMENGGTKQAWYDGYSLFDCIGQLMVDHPTITWNDVWDYQIY